MCRATASQNAFPKMKRDMNFPKSTVESRQPAGSVATSHRWIPTTFRAFLPSPVILCCATRETVQSSETLPPLPESVLVSLPLGLNGKS